MKAKTIKVWDPLVRIFHWSLVVLFVIAYLTGEGDDNLHIYSGYIVLGLVVFRIVWGLIGTKYARFSDFIQSPRKVMAYLQELISRRPKHYLGHNPAGGYMVILLLIMLLITTITGVKVYGVEGHGPLAENTNISLISTASADNDDKHEQGVDEEAEEFWEEVHEVFSNLTVLLILVHILGVFVSGRLHKENLVKAMITGRKNQEPEE